METHNIELVESGPLPYVLSIPKQVASVDHRWPVLCFLHGYDEGAPVPIRKGLARHGPLKSSSSPVAVSEFIVVAPQLPFRGDLWHSYVLEVSAILEGIRKDHYGDESRFYLTGFSFGGNGVFDLAAQKPDFWAALWAVDPTRIPRKDPGRPVWLSSGQASRRQERGFVRRLGLKSPGKELLSEYRIYEDQGVDRVATATLAYSNDLIYEWLLAKRLHPVI